MENVKRLLEVFMDEEKTYCPFAGQCKLSPTCDRALTTELLTKLMNDNVQFTTYLAPPVCHSEWTDREELSG